MNKKKVRIVYQTYLDEGFANRLLKYIYDHEDLYPSLKTTFLAITRHFKIDFRDVVQINRLRLHLMHLCTEEMIEEEHYPEGVVSYRMDSKGLKLVNKQATRSER
jgi:hypothetical protein